MIYINGHGYSEERVIEFLYRNHRGEKSSRWVIPLRIRFAFTEWHPKEQWLMDAIDLDRKEPRSFALADVLPKTIHMMACLRNTHPEYDRCDCGSESGS